MARYDVANFAELDGIVKKVRKALGVTAFGVNYFDLPAGAEGLEHNETRSNQEEVYVYVKGSGGCASAATRSRCGKASPCGSIRRSRASRSRATRASPGSRSERRRTVATSRPPGARGSTARRS